jgi:hypothetical protein
MVSRVVKNKWVDEYGRTRVTLGPPSPRGDPTIRQLAPHETPAAWEAERNSMMSERGVGHVYQGSDLRRVVHDPDSEAANSVHRTKYRKDEQLRTELRSLTHADMTVPHHNSMDNMWQRYDPAMYHERVTLPRIVDNDDVRVASLEQHSVPRASSNMPGARLKNFGTGAKSSELHHVDNFKVMMDKAYHDIGGFFKNVEDRLRAVVVNNQSFEGGGPIDDPHFLERKRVESRAHGVHDFPNQGRYLQNDTIQPTFQQIDFNRKPGLRIHETGPRHDHLKNNTIQPEYMGIERRTRDLVPTFSQKVQSAFNNLFTGNQLEHHVGRDLEAAPVIRTEKGTMRGEDGQKMQHKAFDLKAATEIGARGAASHDMGREQDYTRGFLVSARSDKGTAAEVIPGLVGLGERFEHQSHGTNGSNGLVRTY